VKLRYIVLLWMLSFMAYFFMMLHLLPSRLSENFITEQRQSWQRPGLASLGTPINEYDELLNKIREDIKPLEAEITVLVGHYFQYAHILAAMDTAYAPNYYILLDEEFLNELTPEEKIAVVAHEAGHILYSPGPSFNREHKTATEILTDKFASKYVHPKHIQSLLDKAYYDYVARSRQLSILEQKNNQGR